MWQHPDSRNSDIPSPAVTPTWSKKHTSVWKSLAQLVISCSVLKKVFYFLERCCTWFRQQMFLLSVFLFILKLHSHFSGLHRTAFIFLWCFSCFTCFTLILIFISIITNPFICLIYSSWEADNENIHVLQSTTSSSKVRHKLFGMRRLSHSPILVNGWITASAFNLSENNLIQTSICKFLNCETLVIIFGSMATGYKWMFFQIRPNTRCEKHTLIHFCWKCFYFVYF